MVDVEELKELKEIIESTFRVCFKIKLKHLKTKDVYEHTILCAFNDISLSEKHNFVLKCINDSLQSWSAFELVSKDYEIKELSKEEKNKLLNYYTSNIKKYCYN